MPKGISCGDFTSYLQALPQNEAIALVKSLQKVKDYLSLESSATARMSFI
jgi:hypothetical protein